LNACGLLLDEVHQLLLNAPFGLHAEIAVHLGGGGDVLVPLAALGQKRWEISARRSGDSVMRSVRS
jgi:hypothetical protein